MTDIVFIMQVNFGDLFADHRFITHENYYITAFLFLESFVKIELN